MVFYFSTLVSCKIQVLYGMAISCLKNGRKKRARCHKNLHLREHSSLRLEEKIESFCHFILIGMKAIPFYHENGYDTLDPADGASVK